jgi:hypothetical protein
MRDFKFAGARSKSPAHQEIHMTRLAAIIAIVASSIGVAYAVDPDLITNCCECCAGILGCCCD